MIEFIPAKHDDADFVLRIQRIVIGTIVDLQVTEVYVVSIDNWFDFKWLGWWSWRKGALSRLVVPPFIPNRVLGQKHYTRHVGGADWAYAGSGNPLHICGVDRRTLAKPIDQISKSAAFVWYSGNTATNTLGSLMVYRSGTEGYAWYASFKKENVWNFRGEARVSRRELLSFEERGRQLELACGSCFPRATVAGLDWPPMNTDFHR